MNAPLIFYMPGNKKMSDTIRIALKGKEGRYILKGFPDEEKYLRIVSDVRDKDTVLICTLSRPDSQIIPLFFMARKLKDMGARSVCLVAPYLPYMRQDKEFRKGEAVTSVYFAELLSGFVDRLITIDPHLHRRNSLQEIYKIPCATLHSANIIATWIKQHVRNPLLIGPDSESDQWISSIAGHINAPYLILKKTRKSARNVVVSIPAVEKYKKCTPVLADDIISTAHTMIATVNHLKKLKMKKPVCIGIHAVFAGNAYKDLKETGVKTIITSNTIPHKSNGIDVSSLIIEQLRDYIPDNRK